MMIPMDDAVQIVLDHARPLGTTRVPLEASLGLTLSEDVVSDIDMPPFEKATMDGYAVIGADIAAARKDAPVSLVVVEEIPAGKLPTKRVRRGQAARIMTGAPVPEGADTVVMVEETLQGDGVVKVLSPTPPGTNRAPLGEDVRKGETVLNAGTAIRPPEIGILAAVGATVVPVYRRPVVGIVATGDEIVEPAATPAPGQIRNSNGASMAAQVRRAGGEPRTLGIVRDDQGAIRSAMARGLSDCDVLLLSGGVSAGLYDLVQGVMKDLGVRVIFDRIRMKPGKPLTFGVREEKLVFGLPGNPVSSVVGLELLVRPALCTMLGRPDVHLPRVRAVLDADFRQSPGRQQFVPAQAREVDGRWHTRWVGHHGSADLFSLRHANSLFVVGAGATTVRAGEEVEAILFSGW